MSVASRRSRKHGKVPFTLVPSSASIAQISSATAKWILECDACFNVNRVFPVIEDEFIVALG